jgi:hypothetical protein
LVDIANYGEVYTDFLAMAKKNCIREELVPDVIARGRGLIQREKEG